MTDTNVSTTEQTPPSDLVEAEVCGAGCSYFTKEFIRDPTGDPLINPANGQPMLSIQRKEAVMGDIVKVTPYEFARLSAPDVAVLQEPGSRPLPNNPNRPRIPTPFGVPIEITDPDDPDFGKVAGFRGPVMGDPAPQGAGLTDAQLRNVSGALTPEQALALQQKALGSEDPEKGTDDTLYDSYLEMGREGGKPSLVEAAKEEGLEVTRQDGRTDLDPTMEDYARALAEANRDPEDVG